MAKQVQRVFPLDDLDDFEVADNDPDVRGWSVHAADGREVGKVEELIVDPEARRVRYLAVDLNTERDRSQRKVLVPVGVARLRDEEDEVVLEGLSTSQMATLPTYSHAVFDHRYEDNVRSILTVDRNRGTGASYYDHDLYNDERFYGARRRSR